MDITISSKEHCHLCGKEDFKVLVEVNKRPSGETDYGIDENDYFRKICQCNNCLVFFNLHDDLLSDDFYSGHYNASIKMGNILKRFEKIINFSLSQSDNKQRAKRVNDYVEKMNNSQEKINILDVGSGTCVFLYEMKKFGHSTYCIDPDPVSVEHAIKNVKVDGGFKGTLEEYSSDIKFNLITFNKVLEHIKNPSEILIQAQKHLIKDGIIYVELPDGTELARAGNLIDRSEFYLEHYTTFNKGSFETLAKQAKMKIELLEQIEDPSGKRTIYGFLKKE